MYLSFGGQGSVFKLGSLLLVAANSLKAQINSNSTSIPTPMTRERDDSKVTIEAVKTCVRTLPPLPHLGHTILLENLVCVSVFVCVQESTCIHTFVCAAVSIGMYMCVNVGLSVNLSQRKCVSMCLQPILVLSLLWLVMRMVHKPLRN